MAERGYKLGPVLTDKIISVVRRVESMPYSSGRTEIPTRFEDDDGGSSRGHLRRGTYTGAWTIGATKVVTLNGSTQTYSVTNYCVDAAGDTASTSAYTVIFNNVMGTQTAVEIQHPSSTCTMTIAGFDLTKLPNYDANSIQMLGHGGGGTNSTACQKLQWYSVLTCTGTTTCTAA